MTKLKFTSVVILSVVFIVCCQSIAALAMFTHRQSGLNLFGRTFIWGEAMSSWIMLVAVLTLIGLIFICCSNEPSYMGYAIVLTLGSFAFMFVMMAFYDHLIDRTSIGTVQSTIEADLTQRDLALYGELGFYGGLLEQPTSGERTYYVCGTVNNYGPFSYQPFAGDIALGEERFVEVASGLCSITERRYADGYWVCVKRFRTAEDLSINVEHLDDLRSSIQQARFENYRGAATDAAQIFQALEQELGDIVQ